MPLEGEGTTTITMSGPTPTARAVPRSLSRKATADFYQPRTLLCMCESALNLNSDFRTCDIDSPMKYIFK